MGHTMSIHSQNDAVILEFGLHKPAYRICVNTPTTHGSIGLTTGLDPAMTLGCGGFGGNITSDNISPRHLLNIKRVAYELRPAVPRSQGSTVPGQNSGTLEPRNSGTPAPALPKAPQKPPAEPISADALTNRIDRFLATRGLAPTAPQAPSAPQALAPSEPPKPAEPEAFICEDDVRRAAKEGRKLLVGDRTIITPAARDAAQASAVLSYVGWPS
jgi:acetaldehyde dehydrogenase (acetylating)